MANINILDFEIANRIAAGEVVDRPASVLKELLENAIDAGATEVTAEIRRGGVAMIRVTDNGCGMEPEDLPLALKRHATSKIRTVDDLDAIGTLGFRGEALAAIASVSRITLMSKTATAASGTMLTAEGGRVTEVSEVGCANGTTVTVEELFGAVPARRKFLKKDATEAMACVAFVEKVAMSRPDISFRMISDGVLKFSTAGDGKVQDALYAILGRDIATRLLSVDGDVGGVRVRGFVGRSDNVKNSRNYQNFFINGRYVRSKTAMAALERAFTSYIAPGKFPVAVLYLDMAPGSVDVNVHPAKLEVKFSDEHTVFEAVYYAVRHALEAGDYRPEMTVPAPQAGKEEKPCFPGTFPAATQVSAPLYREASSASASERYVSSPPKAAAWEQLFSAPLGKNANKTLHSSAPILANDAERPKETAPARAPMASGQMPSASSVKEDRPQAPAPTPASVLLGEALVSEEGGNMDKGREQIPAFRILGIAFDTYVLVEMEEYLLIIDQHAAHERLIFEELKRKRDLRVTPQPLLVPLTAALSGEEAAAAAQYRRELTEAGFTYAVSDKSALISAIPDEISVQDAEELFVRMTAMLALGAENPALTEAMRREKLLYQVACKAAIKGGRNYGPEQTQALVEELLRHDDITVCPHGRPVAFRLTRKEFEKQFERL